MIINSDWTFTSANVLFKRFTFKISFNPHKNFEVVLLSTLYEWENWELWHLDSFQTIEEAVKLTAEYM